MPAVPLPAKSDSECEILLSYFQELLAEDFASWYQSANPALGGRTPREVSEAGDVPSLQCLRDLLESANHL